MQHAAPTAFRKPLSQSLGQAAILRKIYEQADIGPLAALLIHRAGAGSADPGAAMDLSTLLLAQGGDWAAEGKIMQRAAARVQPDYEVVHGAGTGPRVLALVTPGDFMANTPIDFLLAGSDAVLIQHFVDESTETLDDLPPHDVAFMAVGEGPENAAVLANLHGLLRDFPGPILNNAPNLIAHLSRDRVSEMLADIPGVVCPQTRRVSRLMLTAAVRSGRFFDYPAVVRPIGSHAGQGLAKIEDAEDLRAFLSVRPEEEFYVAPFVDYRGANGLYAKARVVLIDGKPFASHMACSPHWMVHYLNAQMETNANRRALEAAWMERFDQGFAKRQGKALAAVSKAVGLDYFGIDCAELPDGRLLVFELDVAMIVHDMDSEALFPYKKPAMRKLFAAFVAALQGYPAEKFGPFRV
ncbi:tetratricopeptide repeat-containing protein [bacterium]|nr:tetratricopeptide repeat-containing protein [bacterium]